MDACSAPRRVGKKLTATRTHQQRRHPRRAHILEPARTPAGSCNTNDRYGQHQKPELFLTSMLPTCAERPHPWVIQTQSPCAFFALGTVHACSTHSLHCHRRSQNPTSTTPFMCACSSLLACTMPLPARALFARRPDTCLLVPCLCRVRSICTRLPRHYFGRPTYQPLARVLLCSLYLLCTSCPLFSVVVITVCAETLSLYPMPFLSLSSAQPSLSAPLPGSRTRGGVLPSAHVMCISACMCMCA